MRRQLRKAINMALELKPVSANRPLLLECLQSTPTLRKCTIVLSETNVVTAGKRRLFCNLTAPPPGDFPLNCSGDASVPISAQAASASVINGKTTC